ncbi:uncharacterized protein LOC100120666 [Nasonia vitripennis]|uniref:Uncharacterized protein n=1 Tax=Nasonia vitripennis TaxID=7425 RepID=A0A7M7H2H1_NASVI|nr:uncharacterized protein LOC100120666 [Nasonia vitripennis]
MPRVASSTGLIAARVRPVRRPKPKKLELVGPSVPAPFTLRPFAGLFNPYPYGCSVLCNHPADGEAKEIVRRAKDTWASEGKALLLPAELELLHQHNKPISGGEHQEGLDVPEELFRRYTETDSRPVSPTISVEPTQINDDDLDGSARETLRTTLVLDLRASSHEIQENETLSWRALTLEPIPSTRRTDLSSSQRRKPVSSRNRSTTALSTSPVRSVPVLEVSDAASTRSAPTNLAPIAPTEDDDDEEEDEDDTGPEESAPMRRRGKLRRKKRKCRRGSIYGQQTEVREPPEPLETQVSQIDEGSRRGSLCTNRLEETRQASLDKGTLPAIKHDMPPSFLPPEVLKELSRELDREAVEWEFNAKRRIALEEALRVSGGRAAPPRQSPVQPISQSTVPRLFYRQSARFELLDSQSLVGLKPLDYLGRYVYVSDTRKSMFSRVFNKYREESNDSGPRYMLARHLAEALHEVMGRELASSEIDFLENALGERRELLDFRTWCGVCAFAERGLPELPRREDDPASWLERADFETLERRLRNVSVDEKLAAMLRLIRDR